MLNPQLAMILGRERERELRQARESVPVPRQLTDRLGRAEPRVYVRLSRRVDRRIRASQQLCSESASALD
jgi:hypothetical protein